MVNLDDSQKNYVIVGLLVAVLVLIGGVVYLYQGQSYGSNELSAKDAKTKATEYINNNLMKQGQNATITDVVATNSLYKLDLKVEGKSYESYLTKDGSLLFPSVDGAYKLTEKNSQGNGQKQNQPEEIPKKDEPKVELFVMAFCPFGNKAEDTMKPVYELLGNKVNWKIHYIVSKQGDGFRSLHGQKEVAQDKRELCVLKEHGLGKWFDFATYVNENCGGEGACWEESAENAGLDSSAITSCVEKDGASLLEKEASISNEKGASGSPTLFINGAESQVVYEYGNSDAYKEVICSGFKEPPAECEEKLASQGSNSSGGSCQ